MNRRNAIAIAVLVALAAVAFFALRERPRDQRAEAKSAIAPVPADKLDRIEIVRHESSQDPIDDEYITLERRGDRWQMTKPVDYPVNANAAKSMVDALTSLAPIDVISDNKAKHAVLEVDSALGISVKASGGGNVLADIIVGVSRGDMTMVRLPNEDAVYRVRGSFRAVFNKSAKNLRDHAVTQLDRGSVTHAEFFHGGEVLEIVKTSDGGEATYAPVGAELKNFDWRKAEGNANALTGLSARDFVDAPVADEVSGFGDGATRVEFEASKGGVPGKFTLWIGNDLQKERQTYVKTSLSDQVFLVSTHIAARFRTKPEDYVRTDEEVVQQEEARKKAEVHAQSHRDHAAAMEAAEADGQSIPPEIMRQLQEKMKAQGESAPPGEPASHDHH